MLISLGYCKVVATSVSVESEVQGISPGSDCCVRDDEEPAFKDGNTSMM